jgi:O-antigen/teichoic acid export membrane protein
MHKDSFIRGAFVATFCLIITKILGVLYVIPFYATVGQQGSILYGCAYNIYAVFVNLSTVGIPLAISKMISEYNTFDYQDLKKRVYKIASRIMLVAAIISTIVLIVFAPALASAIIPDVTYGTTVNDITYVIRVSASAILFVTLISMIRGYLQGMKYIQASSISQVIEQIIRVTIIIFGSYIYLKFIGNSTVIAVSIAVSGATIGAISAFFYLQHKKKQIPKIKNYKVKEEEKKVTNKTLFTKIIKYTIPFVVMGVVGSSFELVDMFTVVRTLTKHGFDTATAADIMNIVTTLGSKLNVIITSVASGIVVSLLPNLTRDYVKKDIKEVNNKINRTLQMVLYVTIPMAVGLSVLAVPVWNIFYGSSIYGPKVFMVSVFIAVFSAFATNVMVCMQSLNRYKTLYVTLIGGFAFNACTNMLFMEIFNKIGLPIYYGNLFATMLGYCIIIFGALYDFKKVFKTDYKETIKQLFISIFAVIVMGLVLNLMKLVIPVDNPSRLISILILIIYMIVGMIIYFGITVKAGSYDKIIGNDTIKNLFSKKGTLKEDNEA